MPINYKKYPENWLSEIRPRIMLRANNICENENCDFKHNEEVWAAKFNGKTIGWFRNYDDAAKQKLSRELKKNKKTGKLEPVPNPKKVKVILTIAHLDHDEENYNISDDRLKALCQLCHCRYDAKEKYRRINGFNKK